MERGGRGGRGRMAGMAGGIAWGAIWGALVGGLVLMLAALLLDLGTGDVPETTAPPPARDTVPDPGAVLMPTSDPGPGQSLGQSLSQIPDLAALAPPDGAAPDVPRPDSAPRSLVPRPAQPVLPRLALGPGAPRPEAELPPVPVGITTAPVVGPAVSPVPIVQPVGPGAGVRVPVAPDGAPEVPARAGVGARLSAAVPPAGPPDRPPPPGPLIDGPASPAVTPPPAPDAAARTTAPPIASPSASRAAVRRATPAPVRPVAAAPRPEPPGPRVAFVLDGTATAPLPGWIGARAAQDGAGQLRLAGGGAIARDPSAAPPDALLAYARLDGPDAADATALARIAMRARRDGAVTVLVAPDPLLWDRIDAWLDGPARDLVPVDAASLTQ